MQKLYEKVSKELEDTLIRYLDNEASLEELLEVQRKESLVLDYKNWETTKKQLKNSVFELSMNLFREVNECQRLLDIYEKYSHGKPVTFNTTDTEVKNKLTDECKEGVNLSAESIVSHAFVLSRNKMAPPGFEHSNWYLGPFPTNQNIEALNAEGIKKDGINQ